MAGGYVPVPVAVRILTLPAWLTMEISQFTIRDDLISSSHLIGDLYAEILRPVSFFVMPPVLGATVGLMISVTIFKTIPRNGSTRSREG
jgi:hypothetical protein